jgi:hypothetical protein
MKNLFGRFSQLLGRSNSRRKLKRRASLRGALRGALRIESLEGRAMLACDGFLTYTQGAYGQNQGNNTAGQYLTANFASVFPSGVQIGHQDPGAASSNNTAGNWAVLLTSPQAVRDFLPDNTGPDDLGGDYVNPTNTITVLAGQTLALTLNVKLDQADPSFDGDPGNPALGSLTYTGSGPLNGMTVSAILAAANVFLSGAASPYTAAELNVAADNINKNFDNGTVDNGFLVGDCDEVTTALVTIEGRKFEDLNGNGVDDLDPGIAGWHITVWLDSNGDGVADTGETHDVVTGAGGLWSYSEETATSVLEDDGTVDGAPGVAWTASEVNQPGWTQTFGNAGYGDIFTGEDTVIGVDFGNFKNIDISGTKYEDHNGNGTQEAGDGPLGGFVFILNDDGDGIAESGETTTTSAANGTWSFTNIGPGPWTVTEAYAGTTWVQTQGEEGYSGVATSGVDVTTGLVFGNTRLSAEQGKTIGFWSNKNGQAILANNDGPNGWRKALNDLNLRTATGGNFDLSNTGTRTGADKFDCVYKAFRTWLLGATASNMAYMLSAQLAGTQLNVIAGNFGNATSIHVGLQQSDPAFGLIDWSGNSQGDNLDNNLDSVTDLVNNYGFADIQALIAAANTELGLHGNTTSGSADDAWRDYQEALKIAFDGMNNNLAIFAQ